MNTRPSGHQPDSVRAAGAHSLQSVVRAKSVAQVLRVLAAVIGVVAIVGVVCTYSFLMSGTLTFDLEGADEDKFEAFLAASTLSAGIVLGAGTSIALLLGGSALVEIHAQRLDLAIIEADDEDGIE